MILIYYHIQHVLSVSSLHQSAKGIIARSLTQTLSQLRGVVSSFLREVQHMMIEMVESMHAEEFSG